MTAPSPAGDPRTSASAVTEEEVAARALYALDYPTLGSAAVAAFWAADDEVSRQAYFKRARQLIALLATRAPQPGPGAEPVAWKFLQPDGKLHCFWHDDTLSAEAKADGYTSIPLYAAPAAPPHDEPAIRAEERGETFATIAQWCEETFGPITLERIASRAAEEMDELLADPSRVEEAADVVIVLSRYAGLWQAVEKKMAVNRKREWSLKGDGTGYHVRADGSLTAPSSPAEAPEADGLAELKPGDIVADLAHHRPFCVVDQILEDGCLEVTWLHPSGRIWSGGLHPRSAKLLHRPEGTLVPSEGAREAERLREDVRTLRKALERILEGVHCQPGYIRQQGLDLAKAALRATGREPEVRS